MKIFIQKQCMRDKLSQITIEYVDENFSSAPLNLIKKIILKEVQKLCIKKGEPTWLPFFTSL